MANSVDLKFVSEFLDGRCFFVPAYQRGYRWKEKQIEDLLQDLYSFYLDSSSCAFYCLQPVIVQKVTDSDVLSYINDEFGIEVNNELSHDDELSVNIDWYNQNGGGSNVSPNKHTLWEVIDGQQRLTTIYILYKYLMNKKGINSVTLANDYWKVLYSLVYESRPDSSSFLANVGKSLPTNIDQTYMSNAYVAIDNWIYKKAKNIVAFKGKVPMDIIDGLFSLLNGNATSKSAKVIWYEIDPSNTNVIKEFLNINTGKIGLTDSELVKAMFLLNRGNKNEIDQIAIEWENIENALNQGDFWSFLCDRDVEKHNRISLLLEVLYDLNAPNPDNRQDNYLFDFYYNNVFSQITTVSNKNSFVLDQWQKIVDCFRTIEDWYHNPEVYNYVGFMSQLGVKISEIYKLYEDKTTTSYSDFVDKLRIKAKSFLSKVKVNNGLILNTYGDSIIKHILLFANVNQLNLQYISSGRIYSPVYKFPFDIYQSQKWNVEHIDSQTANDMKEKSAQDHWIEAAEKSFPEILVDQTYTELKNAGDNKEIISFIQRYLGEDIDDKDSLGNLALLDAKTNDSYGNSLFVEKRIIIAEKVKEGQFVPLCTQWAFNKHFTTSVVPDLTRWTKTDKENYNRFIYQSIQ